MELSLTSPVLVTGAAGFIGSALIWELNRRGYEDIVACDVLDCSEKWRNLAALCVRDYIDAADLLAAVESNHAALGRYGTILHLGACSSTTETDAAYLMRNNFAFTRTLAHAAVAAGVRFVYASSAATYGTLEIACDESLPLHALRPLNMYAYSKHLFDCHARAAGISSSILGLKYFNVYGPNEGHKGEMRSVVAKAYEQIRDTGSVRLFRSYRPQYRDGEQQRDFIYVKDAVRMTLALAANSNAVGIVNVGSGEASTWLRLTRAVFAALGREPNVDFVDMPEPLRAKYQYRTQAGVERASALGASPTISLEDGVADYVRNYLVPGKLLDPLDVDVTAERAALVTR